MDTVIGIPARNEAATVAQVVAAADAGLQRFCAGENLIVLADNGSTDGTPEAFRSARAVTPQEIIHTGSAAETGKGTNVLALVDVAIGLNADRLILLDADVRSVTPEWIGRFAAATPADQPILATPIYMRDRYEAEVTAHIARPLVAALWGTVVQQPIGGDFALTRPALRQVARWPRPDSVYLYGIDIWLTTGALQAGYPVAEVDLGMKLHRPGFPKVLRLPLEVVDSLFHAALRLGPDGPNSTDLMLPAQLPTVMDRSVPQDQSLIARVSATVAGYLTDHRPGLLRLFPTTRHLPPAPWGYRVDGSEWPSLLAEALDVLASGQFQVARDHLVALYIARTLSFWDEVASLSPTEVATSLYDQVSETAREVGKRGIRFTGPGPRTFSRGYWTDVRLRGGRT
jgi:hypothetical protein